MPGFELPQNLIRNLQDFGQTFLQLASHQHNLEMKLKERSAGVPHFPEAFPAAAEAQAAITTGLNAQNHPLVLQFANGISLLVHRSQNENGSFSYLTSDCFFGAEVTMLARAARAANIPVIPINAPMGATQDHITLVSDYVNNISAVIQPAPALPVIPNAPAVVPAIQQQPAVLPPPPIPEAVEPGDPPRPPSPPAGAQNPIR